VRQVKVTGKVRGKPWEFRGDADELASAKEFLDKLMMSSPVVQLCGKGVDPRNLFEFFLHHSADDGEFREREVLRRAKEIQAAYRAFEKLMSALQAIQGLPGLSDFDELNQEGSSGEFLRDLSKLKKRPKHRPRDSNEAAFILGLAKLVHEATGKFHDPICQDIFTMRFGYRSDTESYRIRRERLWNAVERKSA
jgi:hypothetical protein